jgi:hypothetical protein
MEKGVGVVEKSGMAGIFDGRQSASGHISWLQAESF